MDSLHRRRHDRTNEPSGLDRTHLAQRGSSPSSRRATGVAGRRSELSRRIRAIPPFGSGRGRVPDDESRPLAEFLLPAREFAEGVVVGIEHVHGRDLAGIELVGVEQVARIVDVLRLGKEAEWALLPAFASVACDLPLADPIFCGQPCFCSVVWITGGCPLEQVAEHGFEVPVVSDVAAPLLDQLLCEAERHIAEGAIRVGLSDPAELMPLT
jgi:hypothetical protein